MAALIGSETGHHRGTTIPIRILPYIFFYHCKSDAEALARNASVPTPVRWSTTMGVRTMSMICCSVLVYCFDKDQYFDTDTRNLGTARPSQCDSRVGVHI